MADTTLSALSLDVRKFIAEQVLSVVERTCRFMEYGLKAQIPDKQGKTFYATRYNRVALPQSQLSEGQTPTSTAMTITQISAIAEQWGATVRLTDVAELTVAHPLLQQAIEKMGLNANELTDREIRKVLDAGTNVFYGDLSVSARVSVTTGMVFSEGTHKKVVASLRQGGARGFSKPEKAMDDPALGDEFVCVVDPFIEFDVTGFTGWKDANTYANAKRLWNGEAGEFAGVRFVRSNFIPILTSHAAASVAGGSVGSGGLNDGTYYTVVTAVSDDTGNEQIIYQAASTAVANGAGQNKLTVTIPSGSGYHYNVYVGTASATAGPFYLVSSSQAPAASVVVLAIDNTAATSPALPNAAGSKIHTLYYIGKEAYTVVHLQNLQTYITPLQESDSDPLIQRRTIGWKAMFKALVNNDAYLARLECESAYDDSFSN